MAAIQQLLRRALTSAKGWLYTSGMAFEPLRWWARAHLALGRTSHRAAVVIVNWNTLPYLQVSVEAVRRFSPSDTEIIVVDNASTDGSREWLRTQRDVRGIRLPRNLGHPVAMDIGWLLARSTYVVALDVDAFPIGPGWIDRLTRPLEAGYDVAGVTTYGTFVHPCCLAMSLRRFVEQRHTFGTRQGIADTGELISQREARRFTVERTEVQGPHEIGSVFGDLLYHNFYSARLNDDSMYPPLESEEDAGVRASALAAWDSAVTRFGLDS